MKRASLIIIFTAFLSHFYGQEIETINEDFNNDNVVDSLSISYQYGSHYSWTEVHLTNGKTGDTFWINFGFDFSQIKSAVIIPKDLQKPENKAFLELIEDKILSKRRQYPDGSLSWIISGILSSTVLENNNYFNKIINPGSDWIDGNIELPSSYHCIIQGDTLDKLYNYGQEYPIPRHDMQAWLSYHGHNHYSHEMTDSLILLHQESDLEIYRTAHGIVAKKGNSHKWLFVTDYYLTGGPQKLRWESIGSTKLAKDHLILFLKLTPSSFNSIFIINIKTGDCGRLKYDIITDKEDFRIEKGKLIIYVEGEHIEIPVKRLIKELKRCNK